MTRRRLPDRRPCVTQRFEIHGTDDIRPTTFYLCWGVYPDGSLGEIWLNVAKEGAAMRYWNEAEAMTFSAALQSGLPLETLVDMFLGTQSLPNGTVKGHPRITRCTSIMDAVCRSLAIDFLGRDDLADRPEPEEDNGHPENVAPPLSVGKGF